MVRREEKYQRFLTLLRKINDGSRILVFCETKKCVDQVTTKLRDDGILSARAIHGDKC